MAKALSPSATKKELFRRLGLIDGDPASEKLHKQMMDEAKVGRELLSHDPESVAPWNRHEAGVVQPYTWSQLMETARHQQILAIYDRASEQTRHYYNQGRYFDGVGNEENWVISWCLWHSFRAYRHRRVEEDHHESSNNPAAARQTAAAKPPVSPTPSHTGTSTTADSFDSRDQPIAARSRTSDRQTHADQSKRPYWDPVRDS